MMSHAVHVIQCHSFESQPLADDFNGPDSEPNLQSKLGIHSTNEKGQDPDDFSCKGAVVRGLMLMSYIYIYMWLYDF